MVGANLRLHSDGTAANVVESENDNDRLPIPVEQEPSVRVSAGETLALMMHANRTNRAWLQDFADETLMVTQDFYEILVAYKRIAVEENSRAA